ncbi:hypothetical protein BV20DRAFT_1022418 [Pilatotrama ljubarskyi]|nr:hypothetical protein BV20DRAFT_1022418 [Pilatotrama ljubarskyi]
MFGEHESESPRVPSPWDPFLPSPPDGTPPKPGAALYNGIPKLVPEVEEGNVEYKLKLTNISNARFARLVTQLKWRLLEGGGQAYYELGVADSGALIGLSRRDLEESLETLEMMAGEIGASVIVVKEIEVPPTITALADKESGYTDPDTGEWTRKMKRRAALAAADGDVSTTTTEVETDLATDFTDFDDVASSFSSERRPEIATPTSVYAKATTIVHRPARTNPERPTAQSSPFIAPIDDDLALFSMEPEPAFRDDATVSGDIGDDELDLGPRRASFAGLEIAAVYKPRPVRHRARPGALVALGPTVGRHGKRYNKPKEKKVHPWHQSTKGADGGKGPKPPAGPQMSKEEKALQRRLARDKKREEKRAALIARAEMEVGITAAEAVPPAATLDTDRLLKDMATLALAVEIGQDASSLAEGAGELHAAVDMVATRRNGTGETSPVLEAREPVEDVGEIVMTNGEPRLIVEALVVRKLSIEEATLDFSRFSLV